MLAPVFQRYVWIVNTISSLGCVTKEELDQRWIRSALNEQHENVYPRKTFYRHREDIAEIFGIEIAFRKKDNAYYIKYAEDIKTDDLRRWLMNNFAVNNALSESQALRSRIQTEQIPEGHRFLPIIIEAMRNNHVLQLEHSRFGKPTQSFRLAPYCLKVFKQRWYVYGKPSNHSNERRIYALDRIISMQETEDSFEMPRSFDAEEEFFHYYGVFTDKPAEQVRVRVNKEGAPFLRSLPIHHSQQEVLIQEDFSEFQFYVAPTFDFVQQLRTYGSQLVVISPEWLRKEMQSEADKLLKLYKALR